MTIYMARDPDADLNKYFLTLVLSRSKSSCLTSAIISVRLFNQATQTSPLVIF